MFYEILTVDRNRILIRGLFDKKTPIDIQFNSMKKYKHVEIMHFINFLGFQLSKIFFVLLRCKVFAK